MNIEPALEKISSMEVRGAGKIARFAVSTVKEFVLNSNISDLNEFNQKLEDVLRQLNATRPTAVSLRNGLRYVYSHSVSQSKNKGASLEELKQSISIACDAFITKSLQAKIEIAKLGAAKIQDGYTVQTHCNSQMALASIIEAHNQGKSVQVYATESRPWYQGHLSVKALAEANVPVTLIIDSAVRYFMEKVDIVLVGADTITAKGDLINKIGTAQVALAANDTGVPFVVCAETYKFSPESLYDTSFGVKIEERSPTEVVSDPAAFSGVNIANPVFDITPAKYISEIITEVGGIKPDSAKDLIKSEYGDIVPLKFLENK